MIVRRLPEASDELYHHGILGQRWGIRRYQNKDGTLTSAGRKHKGLIDQIRDNRRMKKVRRAKVEKAKAQQKEKDERIKRLQKAADERKARAEVIKTGDAEAISKFADKMSAKEYESAISRINMKQTLDSYRQSQSDAKAAKTKAKIDRIVNTASSVASVAQSAANVYGAFQKVGLIKQKENSIQRLENLKKTLELTNEVSSLKEQASAFKRNKNFRREMEELSKRNQKLEVENSIVDNWYKQRQADLNPARINAEYTKILADQQRNALDIENKRLTNVGLDLKNQNSLKNLQNGGNNGNKKKKKNKDNNG